MLANKALALVGVTPQTVEFAPWHFQAPIEPSAFTGAKSIVAWAPAPDAESLPPITYIYPFADTTAAVLRTTGKALALVAKALSAPFWPPLRLITVFVVSALNRLLPAAFCTLKAVVEVFCT